MSKVLLTAKAFDLLISVLRRVLRAGQNGAGFIETVPKRGYRFVAPMEMLNVVARLALRAEPVRIGLSGEIASLTSSDLNSDLFAPAPPF